MELVNFYSDLWVEYQVEMFQTKNHELQLRYAAMLNSEISVSINGNTPITISLPATGSEENVWRTVSENISLNTGKHTLRIKVTKGRICLNWLKVN